MINAGMFTSATPEWYTPPALLAKVRAFYGRDFYDPCPARHGAEIVRDGLAEAWQSPCFVNPPYGRTIFLWVAKALSEPVDEIILLVPARTDTKWFAPLFAYPICFVSGRIKFSGSQNSAPFPSAIVYKGAREREFIAAFRSLGPIMRPVAVAS